jgi:predicted signal transduction protein with EAL and GGDEF domain
VNGAGVITLSVGEAFYPDDGSDAEQLLAEADRRMYKSKHVGRSGRAKGIQLLPAGHFEHLEKAGAEAGRSNPVN